MFFGFKIFNLEILVGEKMGKKICKQKKACKKIGIKNLEKTKLPLMSKNVNNLKVHYKKIYFKIIS
jgi:hypothetical protein